MLECWTKTHRPFDDSKHISKPGLLGTKSLIILLISSMWWVVLQYEILKNPMGLIEFTLNKEEPTPEPAKEEPKTEEK